MHEASRPKSLNIYVMLIAKRMIAEAPSSMECIMEDEASVTLGPATATLSSTSNPRSTVRVLSKPHTWDCRTFLNEQPRSAIQILIKPQTCECTWPQTVQIYCAQMRVETVLEFATSMTVGPATAALSQITH